MESVFQNWKKAIIDQISAQDSLGDLRDSLKTSLNEVEEYISDQEFACSDNKTKVKK